MAAVCHLYADQLRAMILESDGRVMDQFINGLKPAGLGPVVEAATTLYASLHRYPLADTIRTDLPTL